MDLRRRSSPFSSAQVPPDHSPHHPDSQNHNSSTDTEDNGRLSLSPCDNEPPSPLLRKASPSEPGRADSQNHSSSAAANQDTSMTSTQPFSSNSQLLSDTPLNGVQSSPFDVYGDLEDNVRSPFEPGRPDSRNHSSGADTNQKVNSTQWFSSSSQLCDTLIDDTESLDFLVYGDKQDDGRRSLPRYNIEPLPPFPSESNNISPGQLRTERQSEVGSPLASNKSNESSLFYPINPSSSPSRVSCLITPVFSSYTHCWHFVTHKSRTVKVAKSYLTGMPVKRTGVLGRAGRCVALCSALCPLIVAKRQRSGVFW
ncbi:hypothetical protein SMACR_12807 [Sordaria macrospora]|uniref:Uncharacterized protein n=1 Tax=Sordaria macrospora TaxID=5147 RepID=A0A8S8ZL01_SORMA|nr:hypothetical protein SMACR_12807 [Sordaria macrospora]WPJ65050.1 hypothetical protein SMAC4_12807 [Sordaria macrospora]